MAEPPERREPLPDLQALPAWLWRRASRRLRVAFVVGIIAVAGGAAALVPVIGEAKRDDEREQAEQRRILRAERARILRAEQRPRRGRVPADVPPDATPADQLAARGRALDAVERRIFEDARERRLDGRLLRVRCRPFPRGVVDREDLGRPRGRYSCLVVTADIPPSATNEAGTIGHPYRMLLDHRTGRYAFCKISGVPGEGAISRRRDVTVPPACGG